jgi:hypothetical protein
LRLVQAAHGVSAEELPAATARLFGFKSTSAQLRVIFEEQKKQLLAGGQLDMVDGILKTK